MDGATVRGEGSRSRGSVEQEYAEGRKKRQRSVFVSSGGKSMILFLPAFQLLLLRIQFKKRKMRAACYLRNATLCFFIVHLPLSLHPGRLSSTVRSAG